VVVVDGQVVMDLHYPVDVVAVDARMEVKREHQAIKDFQEEMDPMEVLQDHGQEEAVEEWDLLDQMLQDQEQDLADQEQHIL
jgi:hypothetical protein